MISDELFFAGVVLFGVVWLVGGVLAAMHYWVYSKANRYESVPWGMFLFEGRVAPVNASVVECEAYGVEAVNGSACWLVDQNG